MIHEALNDTLLSSSEDVRDSSISMSPQKSLSLMVFGVFWGKFISASTARSYCYGERIDEFDDKLFSDRLLSITNTSSNMECASRCLDFGSCHSYSFVNKTKVCRLHDYVLDIKYHAYSSETGARHYSICTPANGYAYGPTIKSFYRIGNVTAGGCDASKSICEAEGGHLLTIRNSETQNWIAGILSGTSAFSSIPYFFVDGSDAITTDMWLDSNNVLMTWMPWGSVQPNKNTRYGAQHCLAMETATSYAWNDLWCGEQFEVVLGYICQI